MPLYNYRSVCGTVTAVAHSIMEEPKVLCSNCGSSMVRIMQVPAISLKGSGFYSTDNK
jgi:putative FmdB family regulatory protein